jgi:hypothetical protein
MRRQTLMDVDHVDGPKRAGRLTLDTGICGSEGVWGRAEQQQASGHFGGNSPAGWRILPFLYPATSLYRIFSYTIPMVIAPADVQKTTFSDDR